MFADGKRNARSIGRQIAGTVISGETPDAEGFLGDPMGTKTDVPVLVVWIDTATRHGELGAVVSVGITETAHSTSKMQQLTRDWTAVDGDHAWAAPGYRLLKPELDLFTNLVR